MKTVDQRINRRLREGNGEITRKKSWEASGDIEMTLAEFV